MTMNIDSQIQAAIPGTRATPGTLLSVSAQVKQEAVRWREAASANRWEVLTAPIRRDARNPRYSPLSQPAE